ncbi:MAG: hypothetical protein V8Q54_01990 [Alistipes senegalensis]
MEAKYNYAYTKRLLDENKDGGGGGNDDKDIRTRTRTSRTNIESAKPGSAE